MMKNTKHRFIFALTSSFLLSGISGCNYDAGAMSRSLSESLQNLFELTPAPPTLTVADASPTPSVIWDQSFQDAVVIENSGPTVASRAYGMLHTAMYNTWSAYADTPISTTSTDKRQRPNTENTDTNKALAMSHAAYQVGIALFPEQKATFDDTMKRLGYTLSDNTTPARLGREFAAELLKQHENDGSDDTSSYKAINTAGVTTFIDRWTPDVINNKQGSTHHQAFLTPQWGKVTPFSLIDVRTVRPPAPARFLASGYETAVVDLAKKTITLNNDVKDITPELVGKVINQKFIDQTNEVINYSAQLTEKQKLIAEFWEDGSGTSFPPGTWMTIGHYVSNRDNHNIDDDAKLFFMLGNAVFDAGIAVWESKTFYDYARPFATIRALGKLGLVGEKNASGNYVIAAYSPAAQKTQRIPATEFVTYQMPESDYSPPFAEYVSGHSGFSAAAATVLKKYTGSDNFGASYTFEAGSSRFEPSVMPTRSITLSWDTYTDAAKEAGLSRLYGGIHFRDGNENGSVLGEKVGLAVYKRAQFFIQGGA